MMELFRLDAEHEQDGAFTCLRTAWWTADTYAKRLQNGGWYVDVTKVAIVAPISAEIEEILTGLPWPVIPLPEIVSRAREMALLSGRRLAPQTIDERERVSLGDTGS
jgi:hypothetical protein